MIAVQVIQKNLVLVTSCSYFSKHFYHTDEGNYFNEKTSFSRVVKIEEKSEFFMSILLFMITDS